MTSIFNCSPTDLGQIVVDGDRAYVVGGYKITFFDITNPLHPSNLGSVAVDIYPYTIKANNKLVAVIEGGRFQIVDASDPKQPRVGRMDGVFQPPKGSSVITGFFFRPNRALVFTGGTEVATLNVFDLSDPLAPVLQTRVFVGNSQASTVSILGDTAFVGLFGALGVYDISDLLNPALIGRLQWLDDLGNNWPDSITISNGKAYIQTPAGLIIADISDPAHPALLTPDPLPLWSNAVDLQFRGNRAYVCDHGVQVFDVSNPIQPVLVGDFQAIASSLACKDNFAFLGGPENSLFILQLDKPPDRPTLSLVNLLGDFRALMIVWPDYFTGHWLYSSETLDGIWQKVPDSPIAHDGFFSVQYNSKSGSGKFFKLGAQ